MAGPEEVGAGVMRQSAAAQAFEHATGASLVAGVRGVAAALVADAAPLRAVEERADPVE